MMGKQRSSVISHINTPQGIDIGQGPTVLDLQHTRESVNSEPPHGRSNLLHAILAAGRSLRNWHPRGCDCSLLSRDCLSTECLNILNPEQDPESL